MSWFFQVKGCLHEFAQQRQRRRPLLFQRGAVQAVEHGHQGWQVAAAVAQQVVHHGGVHQHAALDGVAAQGGGLFLVGEGLDFVDQGLPDSGAEVFAQAQAQWRPAGRPAAWRGR
jgi:hypothetical protein